MTQLRLGVRVLLLLVMVATGLAGPAGGSRAVAQGGATTFVSPMTGIPITTSGPWVVDTASVISQDGIESITVMAEFEFMQVWFMPGDVDLVEARDVLLDSFAQTFGTFVEIDRGAYGNVSYSLDITSSEGIEFGVFSLFLGQRESGFVEYYVYFGALSMFAQGFASAQQNVMVNGTGVFSGVDGAGLQNLLLANAGVTGASTTTTTEAPPLPTAEPVQPTPPPAQPTQPPAQPTQPSAPDDGPASNDGATYLESLQGETAYLQTTIDDFLTGYFLMESNPETAVAEMNRVAEDWRAYPQRAAAIVAPPGFEAVDASYREIATEAEALAGLWDGVIQSARADDGTLSTKLGEILLRVMSFQVLIDDLNMEITAAGGATTATTEPTQAPADTPSQPTEEPATTGTNEEGAAYEAAIAGETQAIMDSLVSFAEGMQAVGSTDAAEQEQGVDQVNTAIEYWATYDDVAAGITAPAGYEDVDAAYQQLAGDVTELATLFDAWFNAPEATRTEAIEEFTAALSDVQTQAEDLNAMVTGGSTAGTTSTTTTTEPEDPLEDVTETGNRGQLPDDPDEPEDVTAVDYESLGLVSDTEYVSPQFDIEIAWDDQFAFDGEVIEEAIGSDEEDWITLIWTGGDAGDITISLAEIEDFDPEIMVAYWESDEYLDQFPIPGEALLAEASSDRGGVLILLDDDEEGIAIYREAICMSRSCEEVAFIMVISPVVDAADLIGDAEDGIAIDGETATGVFSTREINRALDQ